MYILCNYTYMYFVFVCTRVCLYMMICVTNLFLDLVGWNTSASDIVETEKELKTVVSLKTCSF